MIKVLSIAHSEEGGGIQTVFKINNSIEKKYLTMIKAYDSKNIDKFNLNLESSKNISNKFIKVFKYFYNFNNYKIIKRFLIENKVDIIHLHGHGYLSVSILIAIRKYKKNAKVILTSHGYGLVCPNYNKFCYTKSKVCNLCSIEGREYNVLKHNCDRRGILASLGKYIEFKFHKLVTKDYKLYDHIIVPSEYSKKSLLESKYKFKNIEIINNPIKLCNQKVDIENKRNSICYLGRFSKEKNIEILIEALRVIICKNKYKDIKLYLFGDGEDREKYSNMINKYNLEKNIVISKGFEKFENITEYLNECKILVLNSLFPETFGLVIFEAIRFKLAPIVSNIGAQRENVLKLGVGLVNEENTVESLVQSIEKSLDNYYKEKINLDNANKFIDEKYSIEEYEKNILKLYKGIVHYENITDL